ncbi:ATP-binding protein [Actinophytocola sp.]|uniref:ATP-binding protein n=1 Tax=Actinophytocola sp. TaxID=1872138 RepID=UPI002ED89B0C
MRFEPVDSFGTLLARYRRSAELTQEELASASGISARSISDMERGRVRAPQQRTVQALATALTLDKRAQWEFLRLAKAGRARTGAPGQQVDDPQQVNPPPCQLPPEVADFIGRRREVERTLRLPDARLRTDRRAATPVVALSGAPGVGKTAFAVHVGHRLRGRYPDGRLFLDLRGTDPVPLSAHDALGRLLAALGVGAAQLPASLAERSALYRSLLPGRRVLVILDNAADDAQVRPLLPVSPGSLILVTSRRVLSGLEAVGRIQLDVLDTADSTRLLASIVGPDRAAGEPVALRQVVTMCANLPLALRIAGNRLASRPRWRIADLVHHLSDERHRLSALTAGDLRVRTAFETSYRQCDAISAKVFRLLSLVPGPDVTVAQTAILAELGHHTAAERLEDLVDASLLDTSGTDGRYVLHDLLRLFARERLAGEHAATDIQRAERRLTTSFLRNGIRAGQLLGPAAHAGSGGPRPDDTPGTPADAVRWLDAEQVNWLAALRDTARAERHGEVLAFTRAMNWYCDLRPTGELWREVFTYGVRAATALGLRREQATQLNFLGWALNRIDGMHEEAARTHQRALAVAMAVGDRAEEAWSLQLCGRTELDAGRPQAAMGLFTAAIAVFREAGQIFEEHIARSFLGSALHELGRYDEAVAAHRDAVAGFRDADSVADRNVLALGLLRLAETLEATGDLAAANATFREAGAIAVGVDSHLVEALAWFGCGRCRHELGDLRRAEQHLDLALSVFTDIGDRWLQARVLHRRSSVLDKLDPGRARAGRERALEICGQLDTARSRALAASLSAGLAAARG